ncbi:MAG: biotin/lipoyl-containing protein [Nannocystaceae bacterium]
MSYSGDSRVHQLAALRAHFQAEPGEHGAKIVLLSPGVGLWRDPPPTGALIQEGSSLGRLEILGELREILAPAGARGLVLPRADEHLARRPVAYDEVLCVLDPDAVVAEGTAHATGPAPSGAQGPIVRAPSSGRFYRRPGPDKPAFVAVGDVLREGQVLGLLEVMKTFTRISYGGGDLPPVARVTALLAEDEADVAAGQPLVGVEPVEG